MQPGNARIPVSSKEFPYREHVVQLLQQGRAAEALRCCDRALAEYPHNDAILNNKAIALISLSRYEEALTHARKAAAINPGVADAWVNIAVALDKLGRQQEATEALRRCLKISPYNAYARALLGILYQKLDMYDCAEQQNKKLQELVFPREYAGFFFALSAFLLGILLGGLQAAGVNSFGIGAASQAVIVLLFCGLCAIYLRSHRILQEINRNPFAEVSRASAKPDRMKNPYPFLGALVFVFVLGIVSGILTWMHYTGTLPFPV